MASATLTTLGTIKLAGDLSGNVNPLAPELPISGATAGSYTNPNITVNAKGLITSITNGTIFDFSTIPNATTSSRGVVQIGDGFNIASGVLSIPQASSSVFGIVRAGTGIAVSSGIISVDPALYPTNAGGFTYTGAVITAISNQTGVTGTVTLNLSNSNTFSLALVGNITLDVPTNITAGGTYYIIFRQDATGSRTCTFNSVFKFESGADSTLTTNTNAVDVLKVTVYSATELVCKLYKNFV